MCFCKNFVSFRYLSIFVVSFLVFFLQNHFNDYIWNQSTQAENQTFCVFGFQCPIFLMIQHCLRKTVHENFRAYSRCLSSYDPVPLIKSATSFPRSCKLICLCFELKTYKLFKNFKILFLKIDFFKISGYLSSVIFILFLSIL